MPNSGSRAFKGFCDWFQQLFTSKTLQHPSHIRSSGPQAFAQVLLSAGIYSLSSPAQPHSIVQACSSVISSGALVRQRLCPSGSTKSWKALFTLLRLWDSLAPSSYYTALVFWPTLPIHQTSLEKELRHTYLGFTIVHRVPGTPKTLNEDLLNE